MGAKATWHPTLEQEPAGRGLGVRGLNSGHKPGSPDPGSLTIVQGLMHQQEAQQQPNLHRQARLGRAGRRRCGLSRAMAGAGQSLPARDTASGREPRRVGAGAWDATAGGFGFMRRDAV